MVGTIGRHCYICTLYFILNIDFELMLHQVIIRHQPLYVVNSVSSVGVKHGLQLVLNVEEYEYMKGPHNAVGLKLLLHQQDDLPLMQDFGDNVQAGLHTFVSLSFTNVSTVLMVLAEHLRVLFSEVCT